MPSSVPVSSSTTTERSGLDDRVASCAVRTVLLANNRLGAAAARYLRARGELVGLVLHTPDRRKAGKELADIDVSTWTWPEGLDDVRALEPECLLSVLFGHLIPKTWLEVPTWRAVNLHPALLPWNRGAATNAWPLVDGSPAGVSLHVMDEQIDTGALLAQREVATDPADTAETLYRRLEVAGLDLLRETWPALRDIEPVPQPAGGSAHRLADLAALDLTEADLPVLDRLRARTFPPYGAEFVRDGRRYRVRVEIEPID